MLAERWKAIRLVASNFQAAKSLDAVLNVLLAEPFELLSRENAEDADFWDHYTIYFKQGVRLIMIEDLEINPHKFGGKSYRYSVYFVLKKCSIMSSIVKSDIQYLTRRADTERTSGQCHC